MHDELYRAAELYDIAFDFKDVAAECDFLEAICAKHFRGARSFLELAAGPAHHTIEMARRGLRASALDRAPSMVRYAKQKALHARARIDYHQADMIDFTLGTKVDLAVILMDSTSYLLDNVAVIRHLNAVADALEEGGVYVLEMAHPRGGFRVGRSTRDSWEMERCGKRVRVTWGSQDDPFDPITQLTQTSFTLEWWEGTEHGVIRDRGPQRCFTFNELDALVRATGRFEIVEVFGAMRSDVPFTNEDAAWRMVPVLRRATKTRHPG